MPENEFEKKISSELQQLKFKPSETVWMKVEERIQKKKKRRVFIIVFLLAGIALLGYWQWDNFFGGKKNEITQTQTSTVEKNDNSDKSDQDIKKENKLNKEKQIEEAEAKNKNDKEKKESVTTVSTNKISKDNSSNIPAKKITEKKQNCLSVDKKKDEPKNKKKISKPTEQRKVTLTNNDLIAVAPDEPSKIKDDVQRSSQINNDDQDAKKNLKPTDDKIDPAKLANIDSSNVNQIKPPKQTDSVIRKDSIAKKVDSVLKAVSVDSPVVNIPKRSLDKKWKFGIEFIPGISSFHEDFLFLSLNMNKSFDLNASPVGGGSSVAPTAPVKSHSGFAFQFGGFFKKQFTQRSSFTVGLRWAYYSEQLRMGGSMFPASQSPAFLQLLNALGTTRAYDAGGLNFYATNKYHFFELPVNYNVRINNNEAHPLNLQVGLKIGRMFTSNALVYDTAAGGIYYGSKKHFNKTQFGVSTSLNWKITKKDKFYMAVGPVFDMHFNSLLDNPLDKKKYLLFTGLRTTVIFNSKK
jgi:hypothetical protein